MDAMLCCGRCCANRRVPTAKSYNLQAISREMFSARSFLAPACSHLAGRKRCPFLQVISREMFNPQFSLFQPVPEGGTTFQVRSYSTVYFGLLQVWC